MCAGDISHHPALSNWPCWGSGSHGVSSAPGNAAGWHSHCSCCPRTELDPSRAVWGSHSPLLTHSSAGDGVVPAARPQCWHSPRCPEAGDAQGPGMKETGFVPGTCQALEPFPGFSCTRATRIKELKSGGKACRESSRAAGCSSWCWWVLRSNAGLPSTRGSEGQSTAPLEMR